MLTENHPSLPALRAQSDLAGITLRLAEFPQTYPQVYQHRNG
jgi:hypothetical protein